MRNPPLILVLEDEAAVAMELEMRLDALGYSVAGPVATADAALELASRDVPDLVLADIGLGGGRDGVAVAAELRRRFGVPAVYITGRVDEATLARATATDPYGYLTKPLLDSQLNATLRVALHHVRLARELAQRERQLAEANELARESQARFASVFESSPDALLVVAEDGRIELANEAAERLFGYTRSELLGSSVDELVPEQYRGAHRGQREGYARAPHPRMMAGTRELRARKKSGEEVPVEIGLNHAVIGGRLSVLVAVRDVSERVHAAAALAAQRELMRNIVDTTPCRIFVKDRAGRYTFANKAAAEALGTSVPELLGRRDADFGLRANELEAREAVDRSVIDMGVPLVVPVRRLTDVCTGQVGWYQVIKVPLVVGGERHVLGVVMDVTEHERTKEQLRQLSSDLDAMLRALPDLVFRFDALGRVVDCRAGVAGDLFVPVERLLGGSMSDVLPPALGARLEAARAQALSSGSIVLVEYELEVPRGLQSFEGRFVPYGQGEGLLVVRNGTEQKRTRAALAERSEQLQKAQKLEAVGRLAGGIAHDFNNVLTVILGLSKLLEPRLEGQPRTLALVRDIHEAGQRASELVTQLLAFARRQPSRARTIDLNAQIRGFNRLLERAVGEIVALELELADEACLVRADPAQVEQVLLNLAVNARDAMPQGGRVRIRTGLSPRSSMDATIGVVLEVVDEGCGMTQDVQMRLFEPFFTTKEFGTGTGLGLSTVYGIVTQAGGSIDVESSPGLGSKFRVWWPRASRRTSGVLTAATSLPAEARGEIIVVVEDDPAVRAVTVRSLASAGYEVLEASGARAAVELVRDASRVDLVVTDVVMPEMDGLSLVSELRRHRPRIPILFVTGSAPDSEKVESMGELLFKPFTPDRLLETVRRLLDRALEVADA